MRKETLILQKERLNAAISSTSRILDNISNIAIDYYTDNFSLYADTMQELERADKQIKQIRNNLYSLLEQYRNSEYIAE